MAIFEIQQIYIHTYTYLPTYIHLLVFSLLYEKYVHLTYSITSKQCDQSVLYAMKHSLALASIMINMINRAGDS